MGLPQALAAHFLECQKYMAGPGRNPISTLIFTPNKLVVMDIPPDHNGNYSIYIKYIYIYSIYYMCICIGFTPPPCHSVDFQNGTKIGKPPGAA